MFEKNLTVEFLLDFYGEVLSEKTRRILGAYYGEDLSLAEIAEGEEISRQGVRHILKKGEEELFFLEERLGLAERHRRMRTAAEELCRMADALPADPTASPLASTLHRFFEDFLEK